MIMIFSNVLKLSAVVLLGGVFEAKGANIDCQVYSTDRVGLSYSSEYFTIRGVNSEETKVSKYNIPELNTLSNEKILELINSRQIYFRVSKDSNQGYHLSMNARLLGGGPPRDKDNTKDNATDKSAPDKSAPDNESVVDKCVRSACREAYTGTGAAVGAALTKGSSAGAAVGGMAGAAIGAVVCDKDTGGGGEGGGDGCVVM
jgi:hypothetical protein